MWRVLKLTAVVMGITLLILTPLLQSARTPPDILPIIHIVNYHPEEGTAEVGETVQYWPTAPRNLIINRRGMDGRLWYIAPSLDWALIFTDVNLSGTTDYYRIETTHATFEPIIQDAIRDQMVFWPDCDGMIYTTANADGNLNYWVWYYPTKTHWRINDLVQPYTALDGTAERLFWGDGRSVLSRDGRWLYVVQREPDGPYHIMAISVADKTITNLTADQTFLEMPHLRIPFNEWLVFRLGTRLHRLRRDGTGFGLLINDAWQPTSLAKNEHSVREFEAWDVLVVARDDQYVGVRVSTGEVLWEVGPDYSNIWGTKATPLTADGWLLSTYPSGKFNLVTGQFVLNPNPSTRNYHKDRLSPDGTQLFYLEPNLTTGGNDLWRLDVLTGEPHFIRADMGDVVNYEIAPDSQHVVVSYPDYHLAYLDVASGKMWTLLDTSPIPTNFYEVVGWMHRFESTWQPSRLLLMGLVLFIIGLIPRRLLRLMRRPVQLGDRSR